jgi:hypothetical protein
MKIINRTAITIIPKQPYADWINSFENLYDYDGNQATTILIPDEYDEIDYEIYLEKIFKKIFDDQLESWTANPDEWPKKRDYQIFKEWFDVLCSDIIWDYVDGDIEHDED